MLKTSVGGNLAANADVMIAYRRCNNLCAQASYDQASDAEARADWIVYDAIETDLAEIDNSISRDGSSSLGETARTEPKPRCLA
jgi:hypothetical protein